MDKKSRSSEIAFAAFSFFLECLIFVLAKHGLIVAAELVAWANFLAVLIVGLCFLNKRHRSDGECWKTIIHFYLFQLSWLFCLMEVFRFVGARHLGDENIYDALPEWFYPCVSFAILLYLGVEEYIECRPKREDIVIPISQNSVDEEEKMNAEKKPILMRKPEREEHLAVKHFAVEGNIKFEGDLFVPKRAPLLLFDTRKKPNNIKLFIRGRLIKDNRKNLMPNYLCWMKGVINSEHLEMSQQNIFKEVQKALVEKCIQLFFEIAENKEDYNKFYKAFSKSLKLGMCEDSQNKGKIVELLRYHSTKSGDEMTSLKDYVTRMKDDSQSIYYITGESLEAVQNSPLLESLKKEGYEVLYMVDAIDEDTVGQMKEYGGKMFVSVNEEGLKLAEQKFVVGCGKTANLHSKDCINMVGTINEYAVGIPKIENTSNLQHVVEAQTPDIAGDRQSGQDVLTQNVTACQAIADIVRSSLGPDGLDKMPVDDIGDVTISNDGATILKMLEVEHPAAKVLVELAELQVREVGDGTTSVVIIAAELLKKANDLVRNKIHPTSIISGYMLAMREACKYVDEKLAIKVEKLGKDSLINYAKTSMSSKLIGGDIDFFASLVVDAAQAVKTTNARGEVRYPIKGINILKAHGTSAKDSYLFRGYALNTGRATQGMPLRVAPAKIACLDFNLQKTKMQQGVQVLVTDPRELEKIRQREADTTKERIEKILKAGANVVLTTKGIDDMALKYFVEAGAIAVRRVRKEDLRHVAKATGATAVSTFADMEGEETFDSSFLGYADEVVEERIADDDVILIKGTKNSSVVSLILRGANDVMLDEMDRDLHDALCIVKRTLESNTVVAGGGAVEAALSVYLGNLSTTLESRERLVIAEFAESLLVIPKVLAINAAKDATELVVKLRAYQHTAQTKADKKHLSSMGLDLVKGAVRNNLEAGVIEPATSKVKIIQSATEAAITILRMDGTIKLDKEKG